MQFTKNPFPDNHSDDGVSYAPQSWSERQEEIKKMQENKSTSKFMNMVLSILK